MIKKQIRYRINVSTSVKGIETPDSTVDGEGFTMEEILAESDKLVAELRKRYPVVIPEPRLDYAAIQEKK